MLPKQGENLPSVAVREGAKGSFRWFWAGDHPTYSNINLYKCQAEYSQEPDRASSRMGLS